MSRNLSSTLPRRRRADPMQAYDALPPALRAWLAQAALPWSPASCRRIWQKARAEGASLEAILARLDRAEQVTLSRDRLSLPARVAAGDSLPARDWERPGPCRAEPGDPQPAR